VTEANLPSNLGFLALFLLVQSLVCPSFGDVGKLQNLRNFDTQAADFWKTFYLAQT